MLDTEIELPTIEQIIDRLEHSSPEAAESLRMMRRSEREGWRYADELEIDRSLLATENEKLKAELKAAQEKIARLIAKT